MTTVATTTEKRKAVAATREWAEKARRLGTLRNLHIAGVVALGLVNLYLLVHIAFAWHAATGDNAQAIADQKIAMETARIGKQPLEGLDGKLAQATKDADKFSKQRLPFSIAEVVGEMGALTKKQGVKLTRGQYAYEPVMQGTAGELTEAKIDASLSGDYRPLVLFVNALERDKMFFLINGVTLTGQQSGTVGLRLRMTTYLRSPVGTENTEKIVAGTEGDAAGSGDGAARVSASGAGASTRAAGASGVPPKGGRR